MQRQILFLILMCFFVSYSNAQQPLSVPANTIGVSNMGGNKIYYANHNEPPRAIEFREGAVTVATFLANINRYFDIPDEFTFTESESNTDDLGMHHRLLQQYYKDIPVEGMGYRVHERNGFVVSANGKAVREINTDMQVTIGEEQAFRLAVQYLQTKDTVFRSGKKLLVSKGFTFAPESFSVAYQFDIDVSLIERWRISIDSRTGQVLNKVSLVNSCFGETPPPLPYTTGTGLTRYYGSQTVRVEESGSGTRLVGQTEHGGKIGTYDFHHASLLAFLFGLNVPVYDFYSANNTFNDSYQVAAVSAQWAAEQAYEYYFTKHNRNSLDNNGLALRCYVHVDNNLDNAFWTGKVMLFGDGSNNNPLVELDVVGHELTHGVTQYEAQLQYTNESGALNESFSDILGKAIEFETFGDTATWQAARHYRDGGIRDLSNPNRRSQPDTYQGDMWYTGYEDHGGVHTNSGVQNFWFYLLCEGGSGVNDRQMSYSINAIGMDKAANIAYRNLTEYLGPLSDYLDSRIGSLLAAADLYGRNSAVYQEVDKAWDAVGVIDEPIITSLEVYDITATTVKIRGSLQPRGDTVTYHFEYGTTPAYGNSSAIYNYTDNVEGVITGLQSSTKYYMRLVATNEHGESYAATAFTTLSLAPLVKIKQTIDVTETSAMLYGQVNPNSLPTSFYFEYGPTPALGLTTPTYALNDTTEFLDVSVPITGLQIHQTYYYRLVATNGFASTVTGQESFFTAVKPIIDSYTPVSGPVDTEITITGQYFNSVPQKNIVSFGATRAAVLSSSPTEIKVKVPKGASFGTISVLDTESGLGTKSVREFIPTFTGDFNVSDLQLRVGINDVGIYKVFVEDMDGDNRPDIVGAHSQGFSVFQNVISQGYDITEESFIRDTHNVPGFSDLYLADLDGNGLKDVIGRYGQGLRIFQNFSVPGFIFFGTPVDVADAELNNLVFDDFDLDGHIDIAGIKILSYDSSQLTVIRNQNPKQSLLSTNFGYRYTKIFPYYSYFMTAGDVNNDGTPDLMIGTYYQDFFTILKNNSHPGVFDFEETIIQDPNRELHARYIASDLNEDGWKDIVLQSPYEIGKLAVFENKGTSPEITLTTPVVAMRDDAHSVVQPADINGDGNVDLMVADRHREFAFLKNKTGDGEHLSDTSFEAFARYGLSVGTNNTVDTRMIINDLNGDGRPEIVNAYSYSYGPHDGYQMEIWQNSPSDCPDPSRITVTAARFSATMVLPPNTTIDQFEIEYAPADATYWWKAYSTTLSSLQSGRAYRLRVRGKCYLGFTGYYYINFTTECVDVSSFSVTNVSVNTVNLSAADLGSLEIQYSPAGKEQWTAVPQYQYQISNLLPGTTYDIRYRGRCYTPPEFTYKQFTTLCPKLSSLNITDLIYNKAVVNWTSNYEGEAILEYSTDNVTWIQADENGTMFPLIPGKQYYVRGKMACTDTTSDFIYKTFTTPCPELDRLTVDDITPFGATINWIDGSHTGSYTLMYFVTVGGPTTTTETSSTSFDLEGLTPGTQYSLSVAPQCIATKKFTSITFNTVCYSPFDLSVGAITPSTAELSWNDNFSGVPYAVDYSISGSNAWLTTAAALTNITLANLRPGTEYDVRVHISCPDETPPYASQRFATTLYKETAFAPNPTNKEITVYPSANLIGHSFVIYDNAGRAAAAGEIRDYKFDLSDFFPGMYILQIEGEKPVKIVKR